MGIRKVLKMTAIGDSIPSGVGSDTIVGQKYDMKMALRGLRKKFLIFSLMLRVVFAKLTKSGKAYKEWQKSLAPYVYKKMDDILANHDTSWIIGNQPWCLVPRLKRLLGVDIALLNKTQMGRSWYYFFDNHDELPEGQDLIFIQLGTNDFFEGRFFREEPAQYVKKIKIVLKALCEKNPNAVIRINAVTDLPAQLTRVDNHSHHAYKSRFPFIKSKTLADLHKEWNWAKMGCGIYPSTDRNDPEFVGKYEDFRNFNRGMVHVCKELQEEFSGKISICHVFDHTWYPTVKDRTISVDAAHPGLVAHQYGAFHLSRSLSRDLLHMKQDLILRKDDFPMHERPAHSVIKLAKMIPAYPKLRHAINFLAPFASGFDFKFGAWGEDKVVLNVKNDRVKIEQIREGLRLMAVSEGVDGGEYLLKYKKDRHVNKLIGGYYLGVVGSGVEKALDMVLAKRANVTGEKLKADAVSATFKKTIRGDMKIEIRVSGNEAIADCFPKRSRSRSPEPAYTFKFDLSPLSSHEGAANRAIISHCVYADMIGVAILWSYIEKYEYLFNFSFTAMKSSLRATSAKEITYETLGSASFDQAVKRALSEGHLVEIPIDIDVKGDGKSLGDLNLTLAIKTKKEFKKRV